MMCHVIVDIKTNKIKRKVFFIAALNVVRIEKYITLIITCFVQKTVVAIQPML